MSILIILQTACLIFTSISYDQEYDLIHRGLMCLIFTVMSIVAMRNHQIEYLLLYIILSVLINPFTAINFDSGVIMLGAFFTAGVMITQPNPYKSIDDHET